MFERGVDDRVCVMSSSCGSSMSVVSSLLEPWWGSMEPNSADGSSSVSLRTSSSELRTSSFSGLLLHNSGANTAAASPSPLNRIFKHRLYKITQSSSWRLPKQRQLPQGLPEQRPQHRKVRGTPSLILRMQLESGTREKSPIKP
nr:uncharacterized protein LOC129388340 [Dermacentor andersoni]